MNQVTFNQPRQLPGRFHDAECLNGHVFNHVDDLDDEAFDCGSCPGKRGHDRCGATLTIRYVVTHPTRPASSSAVSVNVDVDDKGEIVFGPTQPEGEQGQPSPVDRVWIPRRAVVHLRVPSYCKESEGDWFVREDSRATPSTTVAPPDAVAVVQRYLHDELGGHTSNRAKWMRAAAFTIIDRLKAALPETDAQPVTTTAAARAAAEDIAALYFADEEPEQRTRMAGRVLPVILKHFAAVPVEQEDLVDEVQRRMDQVVEAAVEWHESGHESVWWFGAAERLGAAIDSLLELRDKPAATECPCGTELEAGLCPNGHDPIAPRAATPAPDTAVSEARKCVKCGHDPSFMDNEGRCSFGRDYHKNAKDWCGCNCEFTPVDKGHHLPNWLWCERCKAWIETTHQCGAQYVDKGSHYELVEPTAPIVPTDNDEGETSAAVRLAEAVMEVFGNPGVSPRTWDRLRDVCAAALRKGESTLGHIDFIFDDTPCCKVCGLVRPTEGWTRSCKGPSELSLRTGESAAS